MKPIASTFCSFIILLTLSTLLPGKLFSQSQGRDHGHMILGPRKEIKIKKIKKDQSIQAFTRDGVILGSDPSGPWHNASCFAHGSVTLDADGKVLKEVMILEVADADGDISWSVLWFPEGGRKGSVELVQGTGKWEGISGRGSIPGENTTRSDGHINPLFEISWNTDPDNPPFPEEIPDKEQYEYEDQCLSFHGPHVFLHSKELSNGISLEFSTQSGVLMSMLSPDTPSPRNGATCFDRGSTVKLNGQTQGDIMLLEDTDADGDVVWLYHIWWYNRGPGIYRFIGGTGKWEGISGAGVTRGMYKNRSDDHFMLKSELRWNLPE